MLDMSGIGRYVRDILTALGELGAGLRFVLAGHPEQIERFLKARPSLAASVIRVVPFRAPIYGVAEQVLGSVLLARLSREADVFFFPHYNAPWFVPGPSVITVHDVMHLLFREYFGRPRVAAARLVMSRAVGTARRIIAISNSTGRDLSALFPGASYKVRVVYRFANAFFGGGQQDGHARPAPGGETLSRYVLYVGNRKPHKNLVRLLEAFMLLRQEDPGLRLVIVGKRFRPVDEVDRAVARLGLHEAVMEVANCSDEELRHLYAGARALVLASLYEGFGLPPLEAMACGTPVVVSNVASLPEVVGDAGVYVNPYDVEDIARGIYRVLSDVNLRRELREKGLARARLFTPERAARETLSVFEEAVREEKSRG
jgi:glycosyltransferase involved in cell wall biosynthesis